MYKYGFFEEQFRIMIAYTPGKIQMHNSFFHKVCGGDDFQGPNKAILDWTLCFTKGKEKTYAHVYSWCVCVGGIVLGT